MRLQKNIVRFLLLCFLTASLNYEALARPLKSSSIDFKSGDKFLSYIVSVPGQGKLKFKLSARKLSSKINLSNNIVLYRGTVFTKNSSSRVAAALIKNEDKAIFTSNFYLVNNSALKAYRISSSNDSATLISQSSDGLKIPCEETSNDFPLRATASPDSTTMQKKTIKIAIDTDAYWQQLFGDISGEVALAQLNEAETLISRQLNIEFLPSISKRNTPLNIKRVMEFPFVVVH